MSFGSVILGCLLRSRMGFDGANGKVKSSWDVCKSKEKEKKKKEVEDEVEAEEATGCWLKLRFIGSCIFSRSKVDSSVSGTSTHYDKFSTLDINDDSSIFLLLSKASHRRYIYKHPPSNALQVFFIHIYLITKMASWTKATTFAACFFVWILMVFAQDGLAMDANMPGMDMPPIGAPTPEPPKQSLGNLASPSMMIGFLSILVAFLGC